MKGLATCSYGINYERFSDETLLFGFLTQHSNPSPAQRKAFKRNPASIISAPLYRKTIELLGIQRDTFVASRAAALKAEIEAYRSAEMYKPGLLETLRPEIQKSLAFLHDYKQFVARVKQNINVVLEGRFPGVPVETQLLMASKAEAAIYWAASLMDDKLKTALLLTHPQRLASAEHSTFRLHGFIFKHMQIYDAAFRDKEISLVQLGSSVGEISAPQAFAAIPHTFLDNALKYSSRGSQVTVTFSENHETIEFGVTSIGPRITEEERTTIFELFKRGKAGIAQVEEGSGVGLYLAQFIAKHLGTEIKVSQEKQKVKFGYETKFSIALRRVG